MEVSSFVSNYYNKSMASLELYFSPNKRAYFHITNQMVVFPDHLHNVY
jgi:hypothetical protein